ncbi:enoyl-CoA hydratase/isomerase family protein [Legionella drancourtii]|uniref:Enoyl-CoA hydratase/isomerase family protein n=1 Tax=Legionella drancourtii LLAP12 TaxID=658187 RepID=G9ENQ3_9GAMM|nr:enoyl-CoA hydratase/isomerase family protein [Legionella drancourtii]EHL31076.1 hypothetical protein LDG_6879 [Legionella drancourtii LLAP12]
MTVFSIDQKNNVAHIEISEPQLNTENIRERLDTIEEQFYKISQDENIYYVVIRSSDDNSPLATQLHTYIKDNLDIRIISKWEKIVSLIENMPKVTLAALHGHFNEPGFQLALACDYRLCLEDSKFGFSSIKAGFLPGMAVFRLAKYIGLGRAKKMLISGDEINAQEALNWGLCDEVVNNLDEAIIRLITQIRPKEIEAILMARKLLNNSYHASYEDEIGDYMAAQARCLEHLKKFKV